MKIVCMHTLDVCKKKRQASCSRYRADTLDVIHVVCIGIFPSRNLVVHYSNDNICITRCSLFRERAHVDVKAPPGHIRFYTRSFSGILRLEYL